MKKNNILMLTILILVSMNVKADPIKDGKAIFMTRCAACHNVNKKLTGPALAGVDERRSIDWIINFVHSSQTMVKGGDKDAVALFNEFNRVPMPDHPDLTDDQIKGVVEFIKSEAKPVEANAAPFAKPRDLKTAAVPLSIHDYGFFLLYLAGVGLLGASLIFAVYVRSLKNEA